MRLVVSLLAVSGGSIVSLLAVSGGFLVCLRRNLWALTWGFILWAGFFREIACVRFGPLVRLCRSTAATHRIAASGRDGFAGTPHSGEWTSGPERYDRMIQLFEVESARDIN